MLHHQDVLPTKVYWRTIEFPASQTGKEMHRGKKWTHIGELLYGNWQPSERRDVVLVFRNKVGGIAFYGGDGFVGGEGLILQVFNLVDSFLNNIAICVREIDGWCHVCDVKK